MSKRGLPARAPSLRNLAHRAYLLVRSEVSAWRTMKRDGSAGRSVRNAYAGAAFGRFQKDWVFAPIQSANQDIQADHRQLVARARELSRNDGIARRFISLCSQNIIGPDGIQLQACVTDRKGEFNRDVNAEIEAGWKRFCEPINASADGRHSFVDIEHRITEDWKRDGEALVRMLPGYGNEFGFTLQLLDPDQLDVEFNVPPRRGGNEIRMGVELNPQGRAVAYWLWTSHPTEFNRERQRERIPAEQIIHLFRPDRNGATRGVTRFAPIIVKLEHLRAYQEAALVSARTSAAKMGFFSQDPEFAPDDDPNDENVSPAKTIDVTPGTMEILPPGLAFHPWDPQQPAGEYDPYVKSLLRDICAALDVSYVSMTGDLSDANYGSQRGGLLLERENHRIDQQFIISHVHRRIYREWMKWAITMGAIKLPNRDVNQWLAHEWQPRGWAWIDPEKEVTASIMAIEYGLDSHTGVMAGMGRNVEKTFAEIKRVKQLAEEYGVSFNAPKANQGNGNGTGKDQETPGAAPGGRDIARPLAVASGGR